jgi:hypothetical protein
MTHSQDSPQEPPSGHLIVKPHFTLTGIDTQQSGDNGQPNTVSGPAAGQTFGPGPWADTTGRSVQKNFNHAERPVVLRSGQVAALRSAGRVLRGCLRDHGIRGSSALVTVRIWAQPEREEDY